MMGPRVPMFAGWFWRACQGESGRELKDAAGGQSRRTHGTLPLPPPGMMNDVQTGGA